VGIWRNAQFSPAGGGPPDSRSVRAAVVRWGQGNRVAISRAPSCIAARPWRKTWIVKVSSWNQAQETTVTAQAKRSMANKSQRVGGAAQIYTFYRRT